MNGEDQKDINKYAYIEKDIKDLKKRINEL